MRNAHISEMRSKMLGFVKDLDISLVLRSIVTAHISSPKLEYLPTILKKIIVDSVRKNTNTCLAQTY
jgi:hypothetical protein